MNSTGGFFSGRAFVNSSTDFTRGTLTYGGSGSPQTLSFVPADGAWEFSIGDASFSDLQTQFPTGGYQFDLTGGRSGRHLSPSTMPGMLIPIRRNSQLPNTPEVTAASFSGLQGMNAANLFTVDFNSLTESPNANLAFVFFQSCRRPT